MRSLRYSQVERAVARLMHWNSGELDTHEFASIRDAVSQALEEAWRFQWWPELLTTAQRRFAPIYDPAATYTTGAAVWHIGSRGYYLAIVDDPAAAPATESAPGVWTINVEEWAIWQRAYSAAHYSATTAYVPGNQVFYSATGRWYQCHTATTGDLPTDTDHWGPLQPMVPQVDYDEPGYNVIGDVEGAYQVNPDTCRGAPRLEHRMGVHGVLLFGTEVLEPWLRYLRPPPTLSGDAWDASISYTPEITPEDTDMPLFGYNGAAQLRAKTTFEDREMAYLFFIAAADDGGRGWFHYVATSADADDGVDRIRPTSNPIPALGCWHRTT